MISVTPPSRAIRMNPLGMKSRAACAPATSARPSGAGRLKLTSRPPPAAAPALRKVRRDRGRTALKTNSPGGFVLRATPSPDRPELGENIEHGRGLRSAVHAVPAQCRAGDIETGARIEPGPPRS